MSESKKHVEAPLSVAEHRDAGNRPLNVAVLTVSDTRTVETDSGGHLIRTMLENAGHAVAATAIVKDDESAIAQMVKAWMANERVDAIILTGGTGIAARDRTVEALVPLIDRRIEGFGELFRMLSYQEVGSAAMLSRAFAAVIDTTPVFALPGSRNAIALAMEKLILPEIGHIVFESSK